MYLKSAIVRLEPFGVWVLLAAILTGVIPWLAWVALALFHVDVRYEVLLAVAFVPCGVWLSIGTVRDTDLSAVGRAVLSYLFLAITFAGGHFLLFVDAPTRYSVGTAVLSDAESVALTDLTRDVRQRLRAVGLVATLEAWFQAQPDGLAHQLLKERVMGLGDKSRQWRAGLVTVSHYNVVAGEAFGAPVYVLEDSLGALRITVDNGGREAALADRLVLAAHTKSDYVAALDSLLEYEQEAIASSTRQLRSLRPTRTLGLADFVYFSLVTVATVGYGDIVPNATSIRLLVCAQILYGVAVIVSLSSSRNRRDAPHNT